MSLLLYILCLISYYLFFFLFFFNDTATTEIYTLSLHDALPIWKAWSWARPASVIVVFARSISVTGSPNRSRSTLRSEEHTSELQSRRDLVCRLLLEKKKKKKELTINKTITIHIPYRVVLNHYIV